MTKLEDRESLNLYFSLFFGDDGKGKIANPEILRAAGHLGVLGSLTPFLVFAPTTEAHPEIPDTWESEAVLVFSTPRLLISDLCDYYLRHHPERICYEEDFRAEENPSEGAGSYTRPKSLPEDHGFCYVEDYGYIRGLDDSDIIDLSPLGDDTILALLAMRYGDKSSSASAWRARIR